MVNGPLQLAERTAIPGRQRLSDIGVMGLCPLARELALRLASAGWRVSVWDLSAQSLEDFVCGNIATRGGLVGYSGAEDFFESLNEPRHIAVFEAAPSPATSLLRNSLTSADRLLEFPRNSISAVAGEIELLELALVFQLA